MTRKASFLHKIYYRLRCLMPRRLQLFLRRLRMRYLLRKHRWDWPYCPPGNMPPQELCQWPDGKKFALVLTHDVEKAIGHDQSRAVMELEERLGFRSAFNFVPERYRVSPELRKELTDKGFEVGVHGLKHDGKLYNSRKIFLKRAAKINQYIREWGVVGFRSPSMHHNLEWLHDLNIEYDASTFDYDPFEPMPNSVYRLFPYWVFDAEGRRSYIELPYTLPQDMTVLILMRKKNVNIWKQKLDWIVQRGGMALMITHPDYKYFGEGPAPFDRYPAQYYEEFLSYIKEKYEGQYWNALPREVAAFWRQNHPAVPPATRQAPDKSS